MNLINAYFQLSDFLRSVTRFPANSLNMSRIFPNFTMKLCISVSIAINGLAATNSLNIIDICNFFIIRMQPLAIARNCCSRSTGYSYSVSA